MDQPITNTQLPIDPPTTPPVIAPPPAPKKSPTLSIILGLVIVILLGGMGYFAYQYFMLKNQRAIAPSQTPSPDSSPAVSAKEDPTANWKTFTDKEIGFSFKYPQSWTISQEKRGTSPVVKYVVILDTNVKQKIADEEMNYVLLVNYVPSKKKWIELLQQDSQWDMMKDTQQDIKFGNNTFTQINALGMYTTVSYDIPHGNDSFASFIMEPGNITDQEVKKAYDIVLSTFKFTSESEKTTSTQNWKTYTNDTIGLSFKYPELWTVTDSENKKNIRFQTNIPSAIKEENTINFSFSVDMEEDYEKFISWTKDHETKVLSSKNIQGKTFERYITGDMYLSLIYVLKTSNENIIQFILYPYETGIEPAEKIAETDKLTELENTINQILSTLKFTNQ